MVELGNLVHRKNMVSQKVFFDFEVFTELNSKNVSEIDYWKCLQSQKKNRIIPAIDKLDN